MEVLSVADGANQGKNGWTQQKQTVQAEPAPSKNTLRPSLLLGGLGFRVLAAEALHAACRIQHLLFSGEEGMAIRANFYVDVALMRRARLESVTARAQYAYLVVSGMDGCLHGCLYLVSSH
jgi:hypothetical protein